MFEGKLSDIINKEIFEDMHRAWSNSEGKTRFDFARFEPLPSDCSIANPYDVTTKSSRHPPVPR